MALQQSAITFHKELSFTKTETRRIADCVRLTVHLTVAA